MAFNRESFEHFWQHLDVLFGKKVDKVAGKGLSSNDYTDEDKEKLASLKEGAQSEIKIIDRATSDELHLGVVNDQLMIWKPLDHIEITTQPITTNYFEGANFDPLGMVVSLVFADGSVVETKDYIYSEEALAIETEVVTISCNYAGREYTTNVNVTVKVLDPVVDLADFVYTDNGDGTYTVTSFISTKDGVTLNTELIIPASPKITLQI